MAGISFSDAIRTFSSDGTFHIQDQIIQGYLTASSALNASVPLASVNLIGSALTITAKSGQTFLLTITPAATGATPSPALYDVVTKGPFTQVQFQLIIALVQAIQAITSSAAMTALAETYN